MSLEELPDEILMIVFIYLPLGDYGNIIVLNWNFYKICTSDPMLSQLAFRVCRYRKELNILNEPVEILECYDCNTYQEYFKKAFVIERVKKGVHNGIRRPENFKKNHFKLTGKKLEDFLHLTYEEEKGKLEKFTDYPFEYIPKFEKNYSPDKTFNFTAIEFEKVSWGQFPHSQDVRFYVYIDTWYKHLGNRKMEVLYSIHMRNSYTGIEMYRMKIRKVGRKYQVFEIIMEQSFLLKHNPSWSTDMSEVKEEFGKMMGIIHTITSTHAPYSPYGAYLF